MKPDWLAVYEDGEKGWEHSCDGNRKHAVPHRWDGPAVIQPYDHMPPTARDDASIWTLWITDLNCTCKTIPDMV